MVGPIGSPVISIGARTKDGPDKSSSAFPYFTVGQLVPRMMPSPYKGRKEIDIDYCWVRLLSCALPDIEVLTAAQRANKASILQC